MDNDNVLPVDYIKAAKDAIDCQDACNLSGILFSFREAHAALLERRRNLGTGTEWFNKHPVMYLFSVQIAHLTGACTLSDGDYFAAVRTCEKLAKGEFVEGL